MEKKEDFYTITPKGEDGFYLKFHDIDAEETSLLGWFATMEEAEQHAEKDKLIRFVKNTRREDLPEQEIPF